jgi:hypothetical protein
MIQFQWFLQYLWPYKRSTLNRFIDNNLTMNDTRIVKASVREPKSCFGQVFDSMLGSFAYLKKNLSWKHMPPSKVKTSTQDLSYQFKFVHGPWNTNWGGRISTVDLLIKVACYVKHNIFNINRSWTKLVSARRSTVLSLPISKTSLHGRSKKLTLGWMTSCKPGQYLQNFLRTSCVHYLERGSLSQK